MYAKHTKNRIAKRSQANKDDVAKYELPPDAKIVRMRKHEVKIGDPKIFSEGCIALIDAETDALIVCCRFVDYDTADPCLINQYNHVISTYYAHGLARRKVTVNQAHNKMGKHKAGEMYPTGHRSGSDAGMKAGN